MEARPVRPGDRRGQVLGPRLRGYEGQPDHATPRGPSVARRRRPAADQPEIRGRGRGGGRQSPLRLVRPCEPGDPARGRRDDRGRRPSPRGNSEDRARVQGHPVRRDDQSHGEGGPALLVRGDRPESGLAPHSRAHDPSRREGPDQGARVVQGRAPSDRPRAALPEASAFKADALKEFWGVSEFVGGGNDFEVLRRLIYSPTCTICGFVSGYIEQGTKTVNPAVAKAKIDFRLVPNMKQATQFEKLRDHLIAKGFGDIELSPAKEALEAAAISLSARVVKAAIKGSIDAYGREPEVWPWSAGASAHGFFNEVVGVPSISGPGVSYDGSNYHAPNEHFRMVDFVGGPKHMAAMFARR